MEQMVLSRAEPVDELGPALIACARGDRNALRRIFDLEAGKLIAIAQRIVRRRELAEEVVQETFIRIWTHAHQYAADRGSARGWIYAIVRNRALNLVRDGSREHVTDNVELLADGAAADDVMSAWHRLGQESRLRDCMSGLDENRRRGILLAYVAGYTHGEIAGAMRIPLGTAKSWIKRGLASLRECLG
jgi:RNA polymerase sigma-70 factor (ECF subfamily)